MSAAPTKPVNLKRRLIIILLLGCVAVAGLAYFTQNRKSALDITYREVAIARGDLTVTVLATGTVAPENRLEIKPPVPGRVEQVLVKEGDKVKKGQILAWMSSTERAALIDAARAKGEEEVKRWEENYRPTPILAPIDGTLILRNVEAGQTFTSTDSVFVMSDRLTVTAQVDETDIAQVHLKQQADIVLDAYPNQHFPAVVDLIAFDAKTVNNVTTYDVDVLPLKTPPFMRSGMTANVSFQIAAQHNILQVPNEALRVKENHFYVLLKASGKEAPPEQLVTTGITDGKHTEVTSGLGEGQVVLIPELKASKQNSKTSNPFSPMSSRRN